MTSKLLKSIAILLLVAIGWFGTQFVLKYRKSDKMIIPIEEVTASDYPEDPSARSVAYNKYKNRRLQLLKRDPTHFDFIFESDDPDVAMVIFQNIDLSLFVPIIPEWVKEDPNLEVINLMDREWNRQQVQFPSDSPHLAIIGGDGFESKNLYSAELVRNCLNAGLWEVMLYTRENGKKALYYQGWFTFPLGHYKELFEEKNQISYWKHWYRLEHWFKPPVGKHVDLSKLRTVTAEREVEAYREPNENLVYAGEQLRKTRTINVGNSQFATFIRPGRYSSDHPWDYEYETIASLEKAFVRQITCPQGNPGLYEIELLFRSSRTGELNRFIVGGVNIEDLPRLQVANYPNGLYMPMGIGVPPFYQTYDALKSAPPYHSPYYSLLLDENDRWINHHEVAIDGPVLHRDEYDPNKIHLYLLSYERHSLVGHFVLFIGNVGF